MPESPYAIRLETPSIEIYQRLRVGAGLSAKSAEAASLGLPNTIFAVQVLYADEAVGMGRLIGDGGCFFQVVDIAVLPEHQGKGLGKIIMSQIRKYLEEQLPVTAYVSLIADGKAHALYEQFGFEPTAPASIGMAYRSGTKRSKSEDA
jgi:GNAT superfamily N-acetyltransferase